MGIAVAVTVMTGFWAIIGIVLPIILEFCLRTSKNKGLIQTMLTLTAACCWLFWLCCYLMQLNPLYGPYMKTNVLRFIQIVWK